MLCRRSVRSDLDECTAAPNNSLDHSQLVCAYVCVCTRASDSADTSGSGFNNMHAMQRPARCLWVDMDMESGKPQSSGRCGCAR